jgi:hypothetical protein
VTKSLARFSAGVFLIASIVGAGAGVGVEVLTAGPAGAQTPITVNDAGDAAPVMANCAGPTEGDCTLRAAILYANTQTGGADITLPPPLTVPNHAAATYTVDTSMGQLFVDGIETITITGTAPTGTDPQTVDVITATGALSRVLKVETGTSAAISGVTITGGAGDNGGGILDCGNLALTASTLTSNTANNGGGVEVESSGTGTFTDDTITGNTANNDEGGGVYIEDGTNTFTGGSIANNTANDDGEGGGVFIDDGINSFSAGSVTGNTATDSDGSGGGFYVDGGTNTITDETVNDNTAGGNGGGGGAYFDGGTNTFTGGSIDSNNAYEGAGAYLDGGTESFSQADISSNMAEESGGGLWISVEDVSEPTTITSSTISQNKALGALGEELNGDGGGIISFGCNQTDLTNDTITGNTSLNFGGGYFGVACGLEAAPNESAATPHVVDSLVTSFLFDTITDNTSTNGNGGNFAQEDESTITLAESIVAGGTSDGDPQNCEIDNSAPGSFTSLGYNLIDDTTCGTPGTGDIIGQSPQLGALGTNGGPTNTELPAAGSPAIGGVPAAVCTGTGVTTDQRGNARGAGLNGTCTIGSVEVSVAAPPAVNLNGYRLVANEGGIFDFGLNFDGSLANNHLNAPIVGIANSPGYDGYLMAGGDGGVFALGGANFYGSLGGQTLPSPISAIAAPPSENGYWLVAQNGKIYNFGSAPPLPAVSVPSGAHIVGMASTQDGGGGWLTDNLGDVYAEGDALYEGGLGGVHLNKPIVGIAAAASGQGYVLAASDGGAFNYGTQHFFGSVPGSLAPGQKLTAPVVGIAVTHSGNGYWFVGSDGGVFNYGDAPFLGSIYTAIGNHPLNGPVVGIQHLGEVPTP